MSLPAGVVLLLALVCLPEIVLGQQVEYSVVLGVHFGRYSPYGPGNVVHVLTGGRGGVDIIAPPEYDLPLMRDNSFSFDTVILNNQNKPNDVGVAAIRLASQFGGTMHHLNVTVTAVHSIPLSKAGYVNYANVVCSAEAVQLSGAAVKPVRTSVTSSSATCNVNVIYD